MVVAVAVAVVVVVAVVADDLVDLLVLVVVVVAVVVSSCLVSCRAVERPTVVGTWSAFHTLTSKCASHHSGVHFFDI